MHHAVLFCNSHEEELQSIESVNVANLVVVDLDSILVGRIRFLHSLDGGSVCNSLQSAQTFGLIFVHIKASGFAGLTSIICHR